MKKTPAQWQILLGFTVLDPDGWDRKGDFKADWNNPLTFDEFMDKADESTCNRHPSREDLRRLMEAKTKPIRLEFVGHVCEASKMQRKSGRFVIEVERDEWDRIRQFPFSSYMQATVIDGKGMQPTGQIREFVNPFYEFYTVMSPTFMRLPVDN